MFNSHLLNYQSVSLWVHRGRRSRHSPKLSRNLWIKDCRSLPVLAYPRSSDVLKTTIVNHPKSSQTGGINVINIWVVFILEFSTTGYVQSKLNISTVPKVSSSSRPPTQSSSPTRASTARPRAFPTFPPRGDRETHRLLRSQEPVKNDSPSDISDIARTQVRKVHPSPLRLASETVNHTVISWDLIRRAWCLSPTKLHEKLVRKVPGPFRSIIFYIATVLC